MRIVIDCHTSAKVFAKLHPELTDKLSLKSRRGLRGKIKDIIINILYYTGLLFISRRQHYYWKSKLLNSYLRGYKGRGLKYGKQLIC